MDRPQRTVWFPAKRYGWGWGFPVTWQGWVFLIAWATVALGGVVYSRAVAAPLYWLAGFALLMAVVLVAVCIVKGEKPGWRWGQ